MTWMASLFRDSVSITFIDPDANEIAVIEGGPVPRAGENVRIRSVPYIVERVGYDLPNDRIDRVWIVVRPA